MLASFPPELIYHILSFLTDEATLAATSTVCRAWHSPSQRRLIQSIRLVPSDFAAYADSTIATHVLNAILTRDPVLRNYVNVLTVKASETSDDSFYPEAISLLASLPGLKRLSLEVADRETPSGDFLVGAISALRGHQGLEEVELHIHATRVGLLALFVDTKIQRLSIEQHAMSESPPINNLSLRNPAPLLMEELHLSLSAEMLPSLWHDMRICTMPQLQRLEVASGAAQEVIMLNAMLAIPSSIPASVIVFAHCIGGTLSVNCEALDLRKVSIEHLCLTSELDHEDTFPCIDWWRKAFDLLPACHPLRKVTLMFDRRRPAHAYEDLDIAIARLNVHEVDFVQSANYSRKNLKIMNAFPELNRKGVLRL